MRYELNSLISKSMKETVTIGGNGEKYHVKADPETSILYILRNDLSLNGPKFGCGHTREGVAHCKSAPRNRR